MDDGNKNDRERLNELFDELENVRAGRRVRRRAGVAVAVLALAGVVVALSLMGSSSSAPKPAPLAEKPAIETPVVEPTPVEQPAAETPAPRFASVEIVRTHETSSRIETVTNRREMRHVEIVDDAGLARALRELDEPGGVMRVGGPGGRVILTGSLAKAEGSQTPAPGAM